ncbi:DUF2213 domain-containing protein [Paenibacillus ginsengarvi]|uniref:DUF2213 domain-containing protein n=1 Tax=Paenibacillus ginsengarvi TaxID=400777 RepID=A0A3B0BQE7_9BACL|nr:DUF2213 domain-containing protein [Paenibacillus ginsengarvi]RKN75010.1 DUF2213 domain-containing protein [Paenibacillus ginsengarvi]
MPNMIMDARQYYGSQFSKNLTFTPEGFLIALNVPIARTGWYDYLASEIGAGGDDVVRVYRSPDEVLHPAAIASFEGKPVSDDHPYDAVTSENASRIAKGTVQNVRQGKGEDNDLLVADLVIYDKRLIDEVQSGKREVSAGYTCNYVDNGDGTYCQKDIRGNHVAVVAAGRAGDRVAIKDSKPKEEKGASKMPKIALPRKKSRFTDMLAAVGLKQFAADAEPEEIMDAVETLAEERKGAADEFPPEAEKKDTPAADTDPAIQALSEQVNKLTELVTAMVAGAKKEADPLDSIEAEINRLEGDEVDPEASVTIPADEMIDDSEPGPVSDPDERPKSSLDSAYKVAALRAIKPIIAAIADPAERKKAADAALASLKGRPPAKNTYAEMNKSRKKTQAADKQADKTQAVDHSDLGRQIAEKYNPHYKKQA